MIRPQPAVPRAAGSPASPGHRLEAARAGLRELHCMRRQQELRVRSALSPGSPEPRGRPGEHQNCSRRRDAGLLNQLHELDKQLCDLKIDGEKTPNEPCEMDSRPSSGFYELSDGASGSMSNSSNSVFSECSSSCPSSACFCSPLDGSSHVPGGHLQISDDVLGQRDHKESHDDDQTSTAVHCSLSSRNSSDAVADVHPKYQCDLVSKSGTEVYRYPSPLHTVAVQSPMFLASVMGILKEERLGCNVVDTCDEPETSTDKAERDFLNILCPAPCLSSRKKLDSYILSVIQKRVHHVRTNKLRTSFNADPSKGILRHGSLGLRPASGVSHSNHANLKNAKPACLLSSRTNTLDVSMLFSLDQWSKESQSEQLENRRINTSASYLPSCFYDLQSKNIFSRNVTFSSTRQSVGPVQAAVNLDKPESGAVTESPSRDTTSQQENAVLPPEKIVHRSNLKSRVAPVEERPPLDLKSEEFSSQSLDEGLLFSAQCIPDQQQGGKLHKGTRNMHIVKSSAMKHRALILHVVENGSQTLKDKNKIMKKCCFPNDLDRNKAKRIAPRGKKTVNVQLESVLPGRPLTVGKGLHKTRGHVKEGVLAKPKYKRGDYKRFKSPDEISKEALRRADRRKAMQPVSVFSAQVQLPHRSPYTYIASDSEYSAECESLFHSTVVDTSEDERSNCTTNRFGDSESSLSEVEFVGESTTSSDSEESNGVIWSQFVQTLPIQTSTVTELSKTSKALVKVKASHNLKKRFLRFRSGSLKLMTTV